MICFAALVWVLIPLGITRCATPSAEIAWRRICAALPRLAHWRSASACSPASACSSLEDFDLHIYEYIIDWHGELNWCLLGRPRAAGRSRVAGSTVFGKHPPPPQQRSLLVFSCFQCLLPLLSHHDHSVILQASSLPCRDPCATAHPQAYVLYDFFISSTFQRRDLRDNASP